ncbi:LysR family transcriptional regulator [Sphingobium sp. B11D3D]|uniref:LysR family transcriptional regulator n=1 Tax=Sphingobium sp. B11D3D TaxID=2940576 RepID=UPI0022247CD7|nr:LysR family transcriptional regulator [Sphingobium sp. B11D3D]MCW2370087.1 DNA-binding transcriptional LysR family regulator [Sphingobium sp. B11D3D]
MTLDQLRAFVTVAQTRNMTRAAEQLNLSQPAVSAAIAALEARYRTALFDRVHKGLELTQAGLVLLPRAQLVLQDVAVARQALADLAGLLTGELRIFASQTVATYWLPPRIATFAATHRQLSIDLDVGNTSQAVTAVISGAADLAFIEGDHHDAKLERVAIGGDELGFYAAAGHPLINKHLDRDDILGASWVLREPGSGTRDHFMATLGTYGVAPSDLDILLELPSNGAVLEAARAGGLIAVTSCLAGRGRVDSGVLREIPCQLPPRAFFMLSNKDRAVSAAAKAFQGAITSSAE